MVSDQEIAKGVEAVLRLRQSDPNTVTTLNGVVQQLEAKLGLDLSHKASFISHQISLLLSPPPSTDHLSPQYHPQVPSRFALPPHHHHLYRSADVLNFNNPPPPQPQLQRQRREANVLNAAANASEIPKESTPAGTKRRGGSGGLNKVCGVSPELQAIVGQPALPRTEIVKQLWAYIRKNNLQDPSNKRNIICDEALRIVFETDCTDMFKMNKLLAKHIIPLEPTKKSGQVKKLKLDVESATGIVESGPPLVVISEALANFFATGEKEMPQSEALRCVWEYIKVNRLEDPMNSMAIICDAKLRELFGCESISALGISEMLARHHLFKQC